MGEIAGSAGQFVWGHRYSALLSITSVLVHRKARNQCEVNHTTEKIPLAGVLLLAPIEELFSAPASTRRQAT
jgi:hypothetical protein